MLEFDWLIYSNEKMPKRFLILKLQYPIIRTFKGKVNLKSSHKNPSIPAFKTPKPQRNEIYELNNNQNYLFIIYNKIQLINIYSQELIHAGMLGCWDF